MKQENIFPSDLDLVSAFKKKHPGMIFNKGKFWEYTNGIYRPLGKDWVQSLLLAFLKSNLKYKRTITSNMVERIYDLVKMEITIDDQIFDQNNDVIVFQNGVLNLNTLRFGEHSPKYRATFQLPYNYDTKAKAPYFEKLVSRLGLKTGEFVKEYIGHCISNDKNYETTLWLSGNPGSGKSTFLEGVKAAFGEYMAVIDPTDFHKNPYFLSTLEGKRILYALETPPNALKETAMYNSLVSEEEQVVHKKYVDDYRRRFHFRIILTMNILPAIFHQQDGLWRRIQIVKFPDLPESERDQTLKAKIMQEAPGIMAIAIKGLRRLRKRGYFEVPESVKREKENHKKDQASIIKYLEERFSNGQSNTIQASVIQREIQQHYKDKGQTPPTPQEISKEMMKYARKTKRHGINYYKEISLN